MKKTTVLSACVCALFLFLIISSCTGGGPEIVVKGVTVVPSGMMQGAASSFMFIINDGVGNDTLTGCSMKDLPSVRCELHDFIDGKMSRREEIAIPAQETTELKRGGLHIMLFNVPDTLEDEVTLIMNFGESGPVEVRAATAPGT